MKLKKDKQCIFKGVADMLAHGWSVINWATPFGSPKY